MRNCNPNFDINKLAVYGALLVLLGDFIALLVAYQQFCDSNGDAQSELVRPEVARVPLGR